MKQEKGSLELTQKAKNKSSSSKKRKALDRKLLGKEVLSIDLGQHSTKLVLGKITKSSIDIRGTYILKTPTGCVESGRILDMGRLSNQLKELIRSEKLKAKYAICTIENSEIITREIVLPTADEVSMQNMLEYEVQQYIPVELSEYIVQSKIIESFTEKEVRKTRFLATAVPKELVSSYYYLLQELDITPAVLDIQSNSVDKLAFAEMNSGDEMGFKDQSVAIVDFGYNHINVVLVEDGRYHFNRIIPEGAANIDRSLMSLFDYPMDEVEKLKILNVDLTPSGMPADNKEMNEDIMQAVNMIKNVIDSWVTELERIFKFYASRSMGNTVQKIYIYGGTAQMEGFDSYLSKAFNLPVKRIKSLSSIHMQTTTQTTIAPFANAIGTMIRR